MASLKFHFGEQHIIQGKLDYSTSTWKFAGLDGRGSDYGNDHIFCTLLKESCHFEKCHFHLFLHLKFLKKLAGKSFLIKG